jgi:hypothetical protein
MTALPDWAPGTVCVLSTGGGAPHAIPVSTAMRAGPRRVLLALAARRETLARLRRDPRCALTVLAAGDIACTFTRAPRSWQESLPGAEGVAAVSLEVDAIQDHMQPRFAIAAGVAWHWTDDDARASDAPYAARWTSWRAGSLPAMKLVSYRAPGGDQQYGEVLDGRVVAFDDGSTVKDRLASGDRSPAAGPTTPSTTSSCSRPRPARDLRHRPELPRPRAGAERRAAESRSSS